MSFLEHRSRTYQSLETPRSLSDLEAFLVQHQIRLSRRDLPKLLGGLDKAEYRLFIHPQTQEVIRYVRAAAVKVHYQTKNGQTFYLQEEGRYTLKPNQTLADFWADRSQVICAPPRPTPESVTERMRLATPTQAAEAPQPAAVRALMEEVFSYQLETHPNIDPQTLEQCLAHKIGQSFERRHRWRSSFDPGNSLPGMPSCMDKYRFEAAFTEGDGFPIATEEDGRPVPIIEFIPAKGYVNLFVWKRLERSDITAPVVIVGLATLLRKLW